MKKRLCYEDLSHGFPIRLEQTGLDLFTVTYGKQVMTRLGYGAAASRLGEAIMHALSLAGKVDNREKR